MGKDMSLTATTPGEMLKVLQGDDYDAALSLHELGKSLGCKIEARAGARRYRIVYATPKPKRALFTIECNEKGWRVKANLFHISDYQAAAQSSPQAVKDGIKSTRACTGCNPKCAGHPFYELDGETLRPCYGSGHYYSNLDWQDWNALKDLIVLESKSLALNILPEKRQHFVE